MKTGLQPGNWSTRAFCSLLIWSGTYVNINVLFCGGLHMDLYFEEDELGDVHAGSLNVATPAPAPSLPHGTNVTTPKYPKQVLFIKQTSDSILR